jgi:thioredoxin 1
MKRVSLLFVFVISFIVLGSQLSCHSSKTSPSSNPEPPTGTFAKEIASYGKPVMVDFGLESCVPCKMMIPVMEELQTKYPEDLKTIFVHVQEQQEKSKEFGIRTIPTQIFFDASGKQIDLHVGFISTEDILATFEKFGIKITK